MTTEVQISHGEVTLKGELVIPAGASAVVLFAHGSGSSRHSPRNQFIANMLNGARLGTLVFDLLTPEEAVADRHMDNLRWDTRMLADRLWTATEWVCLQELGQDMQIGYFGASTGTAAALMAAAEHPEQVQVVVSRGGRPDLAADVLPLVEAPTLFMVGGNDIELLQINEDACSRMICEAKVEIVPHASHFFEESGTLACAGTLAAAWFVAHTRGTRRPSVGSPFTMAQFAS
jgi:pimeloyl-ACP methyl ester carboxylesterase